MRDRRGCITRARTTRERGARFGLDDGFVDLGARVRRADDDDVLAPRTGIGNRVDRDFVERAAYDLLVPLGDLTHYGDGALRSTRGAQVGKRRADAVGRLEQHDG